MLKQYNEVNSPESVGIGQNLIENTVKALSSNKKLDVHSFLVMRKGKLICERYCHEKERERPHILMSISKSFASLGIGMAYDGGYLDLNDSVFAVFPEYADLCDSDYKRKLTIKHLLTMGVGWGSDEGVVHDRVGDLTESCLAEPIVIEPGTKFSYNSAASCLLSIIFTKLTGQGLHDYLSKNLFDAMDIKDTYWEKDTEGIDYGGWGLHMKAKDMIKIGYLLLNNGVWHDKELISKKYLADATRFQIDTSEKNVYPKTTWSEDEWALGYGYQFWMSSFGGFRAEGIMGQQIIVVPEKELVVVMTADNKNSPAGLYPIRDILINNI